MAQTLIRVALLVLFLGSLGCGTLDEPPPPPPDRKDLHPSDDGAIHPGVSGTWKILPRSTPPRTGLLDLFIPVPATRTRTEGTNEAETQTEPPTPTPAPRRRRAEGVLSIDADYRASLGGQDDESMPGRDYVRWDGIQIRPPQQLRYGFDQHLATLDVRGGGRFFDRFSIEGLAGLTVSALHVTVHGSGLRSGETAVGLGPNVGARMSVSPVAFVNLYAQGQLHALGVVEQDRNTAFVKTAEVGGQLHVTSALSVFGGYRWTSWDENIHRSSDVRMDLSGPTFGVLLRQ